MKLLKVTEFKHAYRASLGKGSIALYKENRDVQVLCFRLHPPEHYE